MFKSDFVYLVTFMVISVVYSAPSRLEGNRFGYQFPEHYEDFHHPYRGMFPRFNPYAIEPRYPQYPSYYGYDGFRKDYEQQPRPASACGVSLKINQLIVNGEEFNEGMYPWLAGIFAVGTTGPSFICGGTLVSRKHIVTAAHCVKGKPKEAKDLLVILGRSDLQKVSVNDKNVLKVATIHSHPDYKSLSGDGDIAVLELAEKINYTDTVRPACLWSDRNYLEDVVGLRGTVAGWGKNENGTLSLSRPKVVQMPIVSQETCLRSNAHFVSVTSERTFCAGEKDGSGPCNGDSGGGFVMSREGQWILRGLVSLSLSSGVPKNGCDLSMYIVFTDVSKFFNWLFSVINNKIIK